MKRKSVKTSYLGEDAEGAGHSYLTNSNNGNFTTRIGYGILDLLDHFFFGRSHVFFLWIEMFH